MADYRIWGRIRHAAPDVVLAIASAVPDSASPGDLRADVETAMAESLEQAKRELEPLCVLVGSRIRDGGGRIVDVEVEVDA